MAHQNPDGIYSLPAAADLSGSQFQGVTINTSGALALSAIGTSPDGILDNAPVLGAQGRFYCVGKVLKMRVGTGGVTLGAKVCLDATGKIVISATTGHVYAGKALEVGAAGEIVSVLIRADLGAVP